MLGSLFPARVILNDMGREQAFAHRARALSAVQLPDPDRIRDINMGR